MKKICNLAFLVLLFSSFSEAYFKQNDTGEEAFSFLGSFYSPRNAALENANGAMPFSDIGVSFLNPASFQLSPEQKNAVAFYWQTGEFADNQGSVSLARKFNTMTATISYGWIKYGDIDGYDENGNATGETYNPQSSVTAATLSFPLPHFEFGTTLKFATDLLSGKSNDQTAMALALDWGVLWQSQSKKVGVGFAARDFGKMIRAYVKDGDDDYGLDETFALSGFYTPGALPRLTLFAETTVPRYAESAISIAGEYAIGSSLFARIGFSRTWLDISRDVKEIFSSAARPNETNDARLFSAGLGYSGSRFALDYAFSYLAQGLGTEHRVGLSFHF